MATTLRETRRSRTRWILAAIMLVYLAGSLVGIDFGLPNRNHAYSYHPDEWTYFQMLRSMDPAHLDFNPHYYVYPTLPVYWWGAIFEAAHVLGFVPLQNSERFFFEHPESLYRMILLGRLWVVLFGVGTIWLTYLTARRLGLGRNPSLFAALLAAVHPAFVVESHFMKTNVQLAFFTMATLLAADRWIRRGGARKAAFAGVMAGLALSMKYTAMLLAPVLVLAGVLSWSARRRGGAMTGSEAAWRAGRETVLCGFVVLAVFVMGTPYAVVNLAEFWNSAGVIVGWVLPTGDPGASSPMAPGMAIVRLMDVSFTASTPLLVVLSMIGAVILLRRRGPLALLTLALFAVSLATFLRGTGSVASESRYVYLFPGLALMAAVAVVAVWRRRRRLGFAIGATTLVVTAGWTAFLDTRFVGPMPQELASQWALANVGDHEKVYLASKADYWNPDVPAREYLQKKNVGNYERRTNWVFVEGSTYEEARAGDPDVVFLTVHFPRAPTQLEWLHDPAYQVVAEFPGKLRIFGRRVPVWIDFWDVDIWALRRRTAP